MVNEKENLNRLCYIIDELSSLDNELKSTTRKEIVLKACIVKLCNQVSTSVQGNESSLDNIYIQKIEKLEKQLANLQDYVKNNNVKVEEVKNISNNVQNEPVVDKNI